MVTMSCIYIYIHLYIPLDKGYFEGLSPCLGCFKGYLLAISLYFDGYIYVYNQYSDL